MRKEFNKNNKDHIPSINLPKIKIMIDVTDQMKKIKISLIKIR